MKGTCRLCLIGRGQHVRDLYFVRKRFGCSSMHDDCYLELDYCIYQVQWLIIRAFMDGDRDQIRILEE